MLAAAATSLGETADAALRVVLNAQEVEELTYLRAENLDMRKKLKELEDACPVLFAEEGDCFEHRLDERMQCYDNDLFQYKGRTVGSGKEPNITPAGWLIFKHLWGAGIGDEYHAINGGMRDVIDAWPQKDYWVYDDEGNYDPKIFCLPPSMCYCFRKQEVYSSEEDDE